MTAPDSPKFPAGWYQDPPDKGSRRWWWDGTARAVFSPDDPPAPLLVHYTGRARGVGLPPDVAGLDAEQRLETILTSGVLRAFAVPGSSELPVVCMSDTSPADFESAFRVGLNTRGRVQPWALVLDRELMWSDGARPVLYADWQDARRIKKWFDDAELPRHAALVQKVELDGQYRSDWLHEREWRTVPHSDPRCYVGGAVRAVVVGRRGWKPAAALGLEHPAQVERWYWGDGQLFRDGVFDG